MGPIPTLSYGNHPSVNNHTRELAVYVAKELKLGAMLEPFEAPPPALVSNQPRGHQAQETLQG